MLPKILSYTICSFLLHFSNVSTDHCYIFNRAPEWLLTASRNEIQSVLKQSGFRRFSITESGQIKVLLDVANVIPPDSILVESIFQSIYHYQTVLERCKNEQPDVSYFQWSNYLERTEVYASGPVFVFFNDQLTHIWLDTPSKK